jgi:hypothetical protein
MKGADQVKVHCRAYGIKSGYEPYQSPLNGKPGFSLESSCLKSNYTPFQTD